MPFIVMFSRSATVLLNTRSPLCASVRPSLRLRRLSHTAVRKTIRFTSGVRLTTPVSPNLVPITRSAFSVDSRSIIRITSLTRC